MQENRVNYVYNWEVGMTFQNPEANFKQFGKHSGW
jgi:hypothetical protein